jgi:hypothetical protein
MIRYNKIAKNRKVKTEKRRTQMKRIFSIAIAVVFFSSFSVMADVRNVSKRMDGINANLTGIVSDEYTDIMSVNTANLADLEGKRLYTNMSNLINGAEAPVGNAGNNQLLIGVAGPLMSLGKMAVIGWFENSKAGQNIQTALFNTAAVDADFTSGAAVNDDDNTTMVCSAAVQNGDYSYSKSDTSVAGQVTTTEESGSANLNNSDQDLNILAAMPEVSLMDMSLKLGVRARYDKTPSNQGGEYSYDYSYSREGTGITNDSATQSYSATVKGAAGDASATTLPTFDITRISVSPSLKTELSGIELGATLNLGMNSGKMEKTIDSEINVGQSISDAAFVAQHAGLPAVGGYTGAYQRTYKARQELSVSGLGMGLAVDASYPLKDNVDVKAIASYNMSPYKGDNQSYAEDSMIADGAGGAATLQKIQMDENYEETNNTMSLLVGAEKEISEELLVGLGVGLTLQSRERIFSQKNMKMSNAAGAITGYGNDNTYTREDKATTINVPFGLEWMATSWLKARIGSNYTITTTERTDTTVTDTKAVATGVSQNVTTTQTAPTRTTVDAIAYSSGVGFMINENLCVDVTNLSAGANILDLNNWQIGATLKF